MKHTMKTLLSVLLALTMACGLLPGMLSTAHAENCCPICDSTNIEPLESGWLCGDCGEWFSTPAETLSGGNPASNPGPGSGSSSSEGAATGYISIPGGVGEIKFVSTRRCVVIKDGYKEYFGFRIEDGKLILTNADGVETEVTVGEDGRGALEITLGNGETFTAEFNRTILNYIVNNGVFPIKKQEEGGNG